MSGEDLSSLGVQVLSVARVAADVAAAADSAAEAAEIADFETRDSALAADINQYEREIALERGKTRPDAALLRSLRRKVETAEDKRASLAAAYEARKELAARAAADALVPEREEAEAQGGQDANGDGGVVRMPNETQREFDVRTGKITPFHEGGHAGGDFQRRQRTKSGSPSRRKRPRAAIADELFLTEKDRNGRIHPKAVEDGDSDDASSEDEGSDHSFEIGSLADEEESDVGEGREGSWHAKDAPGEAEEDEDDEEVILEGGLSMPASLFDKLFDYQKTGLKWLFELHKQQSGGVLADEMGLGKTVQVVVFLAALQYSGKLPGPVIVVAPATVLKQWARHFQEWWPRFHVRILHQSSAALEETPRAKRRRKLTSAAPDSAAVIRDVTQSRDPAVLITSYEQVRKHQGRLLDKFEYVVLDEGEWTGSVTCTLCNYSLQLLTQRPSLSFFFRFSGHKIRNPDADITLTCKMFTTPRRLLLTGTPMQNNLKELWSLFDFVFPGRLGTLVVFETQFSAPIAIGGYANATRSEVYTAYRCAVTLRNLVAPYLLRRLKSDVSLQLPDKQEQVLFCRLSSEQRDAYKSFLGSRTVRQVLAGSLNLLCAISTLRQICNHVDIATSSEHWDGPRYCDVVRNWDDDVSSDDGDIDDVQALANKDFGSTCRSGKLKVLETVLARWKEAGNRVLIFSQTLVVLDILVTFAHQHGYNYRRMDGKTPIAKRMELIDKFNEDDDIFLFLLSTKVGGLGLNLCGADRVVSCSSPSFALLELSNVV